MFDQHMIVDLVSRVVLVSSLSHTVLPPWEVLDDFPRVQKVYKAFVFFVGYAAISQRSNLYRSISTGNGSHKSQIVEREKVFPTKAS